MELQLHERPGVIADACRVLKQQNFNILSIDGTPVGHYYGTVNIIGEALSLREVGNLPFASPSPTSPELRKYVHEVLAPETLRYCEVLQQALEREDEVLTEQGCPLLHPPFRELWRGATERKLPKKFESFAKYGTLYSVDQLPGDLRQLGQEQATQPIHIRWLQNLAFYRILNQPNYGPLRYQFDGSNQKLNLVSSTSFDHPFWLTRDERTAGIELPRKTIACFDSDEKFLRLHLSDLDVPRKSLEIQIPYRTHGSTSLGLQHELAKGLWDAGFHIRALTKTVKAISQQGEEGNIRIAISRIDRGEITSQDPDRLKAAVEDSANKMQFNTHCTNTTYRRLSAATLFVSTKHQFRKDRKWAFEKLGKLAEQEGIKLVYGDLDEFTTEDYEQAEALGSDLTRRAIQRIKECDAFIVVLPQTEGEDERDLQWLLFELGCAAARDIPRAICVEDSHSSELWKRLRVFRGDYVLTFSSKGGDAAITSALTPAIKQIAGQVSGTPWTTSV
ncbi:MAG: hypothetical protein AAGA68_19825 [Pseudomonadota bacterium]